MLVSDCLVRPISEARRDFRSSMNPVFGNSDSSGGGGSSSADEESLEEEKRLSVSTLIATVRVLLGSDQGNTGRRVTFNTVPEVGWHAELVVVEFRPRTSSSNESYSVE